MKKINVFCVLVLALMLIDILVDLFLNNNDTNITVVFEKDDIATLLFALFVSLTVLGAIVVAVFSFVKFVLNVNRNQVFVEKNVKLIRKYGCCAVLVGVCTMILTAFIGNGFWDAVVDGLDALCEGFFALLMGEVFVIGMKLQDSKNAAA